MSNTDWIDGATGYHCRMWDGPMHRCGYVAVPSDHPLYEKDYTDTVPMPNGFLEQPIGKRGPITVLCMMGTDLTAEGVRLDQLFDVHGSLTFSRAIKDAPARWYFGFDCGHYGDTPEVCNEDYVRGECASLAKQLKAFADTTAARDAEEAKQ